LTTILNITLRVKKIIKSSRVLDREKHNVKNNNLCCCIVKIGRSCDILGNKVLYLPTAAIPWPHDDQSNSCP